MNEIWKFVIKLITSKSLLDVELQQITDNDWINYRKLTDRASLFVE